MSDITNPAQILRDAADYLTWNGWTRETCYSFTNGVKTPAACAMGAIVAAVVGEPMPEFFGDDDEGEVPTSDVGVVLDTACRLAGHLGLGPSTWSAWSGCNRVTAWNDEDGRTADEVVSALRAAAEDWDRTDGGVA